MKNNIDIGFLECEYCGVDDKYLIIEDCLIYKKRCCKECYNKHIEDDNYIKYY